MKHIKHHILTGALFIMLFMLGSCVTESGMNQVPNQIHSTRLAVYLNVPKPATKLPTTRGETMQDADTYRVDLNASRVLLFKAGLFYKELEIDQDAVEFDAFTQQYKLLFDVEGDKSTVDFVFLSNYNMEAPTTKQSKTSFYESLEFPVNGAWDIYSPKLIPMWGEIKGVNLSKFDGIGDAPRLDVTMIRALAKLMVESKQNSGVEIKSTYLFRTNNNALVVPNMKNYYADARLVFKPSIPLGVGYNDMDFSSDAGIYSNLSFMSDGELGLGGFTLIPEQLANVTDYTENMCVVVEAHYQNQPYFYRIDLMVNEDGNLRYLDVLRNHQYKIIINSIQGKGYDNMYEAATKPSFGIVAEVYELDEGINETYVENDTYFAIKNYPLIFETGKANEIQSFAYQTNMGMEDLNELQNLFSWKNESGHFTASIDTRNQQINVKALQDNVLEEIKNELLIPTGGYTFEVLVSQLPMKSVDFWMDCDATLVYGDYRVGKDLDDDNYLQITLVSNEVVKNMDYQISTPMENGFYFTSSGVLDISTLGPDGMYTQKIELQGVGRPVNVGVTSLKCYSTNNDKIACLVIVDVKGKEPVKPSVDGKWVVGIDNESNGYVLDGYYGRLFRESVSNFGLTPGSTIQTETLRDISIGQAVSGQAGYTFHKIEGQDYSTILSGKLGRVPDVVIIGGRIRMEQSFRNDLVDYLRSGGSVILMMNQGQDIKQFLDLVGSFEIKGVNGSDNVFTMNDTPSDAILDGPFGNAAGAFWGAPGQTSGLGKLWGGSFNSYTDVKPPYSTNEQDNRGAGIIATKDESDYPNLFYVGNPYFLSDEVFGVDDSGRPTAKYYNGKKVENSKILANALVWALQRSYVSK